MLISPLAVEVPASFKPVALLTKVTVACGMAAPVESAMVPTTRPDSDCPYA